ncbi:lipopolysaccharide assembly protein LapA domain-containing protein [Streptomyces sp. NPDC057638]|uniref:lipopolysaccharide assembly protein LapA domain-containing protein n=1 Tax=Streptomyces sp. NPDC057638 TaxID=3346190 RepID=UPI0036B4B1A3
MRAKDRGGRVREWFTPARTVGLVLAALAVVLIVENTREIEIRLIVPVVTMPLYLALLLMFLLGVVCGGLYFRRSRGGEPGGRRTRQS